MNIQAVFFDMGGTVETYWYTRDLRLEKTAAIQEMLYSAGIRIDLDCQRLYEVIQSGLDCYHQWSVMSLVELSPQRVWGEYIFADYALDRKRLDVIAEDLMCYIETQYYQRAMRPEMPFVLQALKQMNLKIGLISNVNSRGQVPFNLTEYKIRHYFDPVVLSSEYGYRKPDPAIFHYAARLAKVPASCCAYIGDRIVRDIDGARRAGYGLAVHIQHDFDHGENDDGARPDATIRSMTELLDILTTASAGAAPNADSRPIRALLFDAGDILYYRPNRGEQLKAFIEQLGLDSQKDHTAEKERLAHQAYQDQIDQRQYRDALLRMYGVCQPEHIEQGQQILEDEDNDVRFFEGVQQTLIALKDQGYFLGVVTDTANSIRSKLKWFERGGIGHLWDSIISSKEIGTRKPHPKIYAAALEQLGIGPEQAVFVGHKASELDGAKAAGIKTIAFNYDADAKADYYVEKFADILKLPIVTQER